MSLKSETREKLRWLLFESILIVLSILLAFWIDAWWDERQDRMVESAVLEALHAELRELEVKFEENDIHVNAIRQSARELLEATVRPEVNLGDEELDILLWDITWYVDSTFLDLPVLQTAVSGGDIAVISSEEVRRNLGTWLVRVNTVKASIEDDLEYYKRRQVPFLEKHVSFLQVTGATSRKPGFPDQDYPSVWPTSPSTISHHGLLESREFQNILYGRITTLTNIVEWRDSEVVPQLRQIIELIETTLGKSA